LSPVRKLNMPISYVLLLYYFENELYEFLSFVELEEPNSLKHYVACIGREIMHSTHSSEHEPSLRTALIPQ
jgi:hypothetical protein